MRRWLPVIVIVILAALAATLAGRSANPGALPTPQPMVSLDNDYVQLTSSTTPPTEAQCISVGRTCFTPQSTRAAYNIDPLYQSGTDGTGITIAIVDSYGSDTMAHDLHVYDQAMGLPPLCGEEDVTCAPGMPTFNELSIQGSPATKSQPPNNGTGLEGFPQMMAAESYVVSHHPRMSSRRASLRRRTRSGARNRC